MKFSTLSRVSRNIRLSLTGNHVLLHPSLRDRSAPRPQVTRPRLRCRGVWEGKRVVSGHLGLGLGSWGALRSRLLGIVPRSLGIPATGSEPRPRRCPPSRPPPATHRPQGTVALPGNCPAVSGEGGDRGRPRAGRSPMPAPPGGAASSGGARSPGSRRCRSPWASPAQPRAHRRPPPAAARAARAGVGRRLFLALSSAPGAPLLAPVPRGGRPVRAS